MCGASRSLRHIVIVEPLLTTACIYLLLKTVALPVGFRVSGECHGSVVLMCHRDLTKPFVPRGRPVAVPWVAGARINGRRPKF